MAFYEFLRSQINCKYKRNFSRAKLFWVVFFSLFVHLETKNSDTNFLYSLKKKETFLPFKITYMRSVNDFGKLRLEEFKMRLRMVI